MRKVIIGFALVMILAVAVYLRFHRPKPPLEVAYAGNRQVTLYSTTAQVREPVTTVSFGDRLAVLNRFQDEVEVRAVNGATGWVNDRELLSSELWEQASQLAAKAESMPVEARGHTTVLSNLHVDPGRDKPRIRQLNKDIPIDLLAREAVDVPSNRPGEPENAAAGSAQPKKEDWWLIVAHVPEHGPVAGWLLSHFVELDVPAPLPDYASAAAVRPVAWFEINRVKDAAGNPKPQFLLLTTKGPEGQACDFTMIRVYTYGVKHDRYETAFVDSDVCGKLPVDFTRKPSPVTDVVFSFQNLSNMTFEQRAYHMQQTIVRRVRAGEPAQSRKSPAPRKHSHS
jgi:hypothetical protein